MTGNGEAKEKCEKKDNKWMGKKMKRGIEEANDKKKRKGNECC